MSDKKNQAGTQEVPGHIQGAQDNAGLDPQALASAQSSLAKLPILGPALWLYARDPLKKFTFIADLDWSVLPPVLLDQCRLYTKNDIPFAFFTWAKVSDEIDQRLRSGVPRIAPHEWQSGTHLWLIDAVSPFVQVDQMIDELRKEHLAGQKISALLPDPLNASQMQLREWAAQ
jgi:cytolysin-activating lysine-acyltransferase